VITDGAEVLVPDWLLLGVELVLSALLELVTLFEEAEGLLSGEFDTELSELAAVEGLTELPWS